MNDALLIHRIHFAFTASFHYLFPQLTMGLAPIIVIFKTMYLRTGDPLYNRAARFWAKVFGINFVLGVVTGIPMEFEFGTNWAQFARLTGGVIGQPLVMEGVFSFFLESAFLGLFLFGERRLSAVGHWWAGFAVFLGSWLSGFFIIVTDAWMQHPVAFERAADGSFHLISVAGLLLNPWALLQYAHNMLGALVTGAFAVAGTGAYYLLEGKFLPEARAFLRVGVLCGVLATAVLIYPSGDLHGRYMAQHQPVTVAAMEGLFRTETGAPIVIIGQPDEEHQTIDNPVMANRVLSFLIYGTPTAQVKGLNEFPKSDWPSNIPLLFYSYHIMAGLGTIFVAVMAAAAFLLWYERLYSSKWMLWLLLLTSPLPYVANTAGWLTAELGRQPWVVYGLMRTSNGYSHSVNAGNALFTLMGFAGLYAALIILFVVLVQKVLARGPVDEPVQEITSGAPVTTA
jgi:cytochrome d ubiquinol oxidase subunit I